MAKEAAFKWIQLLQTGRALHDSNKSNLLVNATALLFYRKTLTAAPSSKIVMIKYHFLELYSLHEVLKVESVKFINH